MGRCRISTGALLALLGCAARQPLQGAELPEPPGKASAGAGERVVDVADPTQGLTPEQVRGVVLSRSKALETCVGPASPSGELAIAWEISTDGAVTSSQMVRRTPSEPQIEGCMLRVVNLMRFPVASKPTRVQFPFRYGPQTSSEEK